MLFEDLQGNRLVELIQGEEPVLIHELALKPLTHALVLARFNSRTLLVYNRFKSEWELPGGMIEKDEAPGETALRELMEESNQTLLEISFRGLLKLFLMPNRRTEFGALYSGKVANLRPFEENSESVGMVWWDGIEEIGNISGIDRWLALNIV
jgi:8-oxo-dGTP diphosphatase